jgi:hypothetical protein
LDAIHRIQKENYSMPKYRDPKVSILKNSPVVKTLAIDPLSLSKRLRQEDLSELNQESAIKEQVENSQPALEQPSVEGRGREKGEELLRETGRGAEARERIEQGLSEIGRQRQDGGIGIGFSTTFGEGKGTQTFGVIGDPGGSLGLGGVGMGVVRGEKGYDFGLGTGKVGGPIKVTTLEDIIKATGGSKLGASSAGSTPASPAPPAPPATKENQSSEGKGGEGEESEKKKDENKSDESKHTDESNDSNQSEGDYPESQGDPVVIPPPESHTENGEYHDGSDGTPAPSLERKEWLDPRGASTGGNKRRNNRTRPVFGPIHVGPSDGDGRGTGDVVIGTRNDRPVVPEIGGGGTGFKPLPCPEDTLLKRNRLLLKRNKPA